jgi:hypothetical protein
MPLWFLGFLYLYCACRAWEAAVAQAGAVKPARPLPHEASRADPEAQETE